MVACIENLKGIVMTKRLLQPKIKEKRKRLPMFDIPFLVGVFLLLAVGLAMLYSAGYAQALLKQGDSYYYIKRQMIFAVLGIVAMFGVSFIPYKIYRRFVLFFYIVSIALLVLVLIVSKDSEKRWLYIGSFQFQPSEMAKVAVIMFLADYIARNKDSMTTFRKGVVIPVLWFGLPAGLIAVETHLSGAILITSIGFIMIIAGGCRIRHLIPIAVTALGGFASLIFFTDYMQKRISTWIDPSSDRLGDGWQILQSLMTIGSGGLFGLGYGKSRQKYLYMSEPQNDFIFSIVCEELGYIGAIFILALFAFLIWRGIYIAMRAPDRFSSLLVVGIIGRICVQVLFNIAVVTNTIPVTGISLPFFSYGGTALVIMLCEMGLVLQVSRYSATDKGGAG